MVLNEKNLELLAAEDLLGRRITNTLYCSECGYNLKTLPYKYQCPECGNSYDVHPKRMTGIYLYQMDRFPVFDVFSAVFLSVACLIYMPHAFNPINITFLMITLVLDVTAILFAIRSYHRIKRFMRSRSIARDINKQEDDSEGD